LWKLVWNGTNQAAPRPDWYVPAAMGQPFPARDAELVSALSHPSRAVRLTAQRRLGERRALQPLTQCLIYQALGKEPPTFAHIPFVTAPGTSKKLSKRDVGKYRNNPQFRKLFEAGDRVFGRLGLGDADGLNPVMVAYYETIGYLPQGIMNALARLGWSLDDKTEYISRETLISSFTLDRVIKSPAGFDCDKLQSYQAHWMGELSREAKIAGCLPVLIQARLIAANPDATTQKYVGDVIDALGERLVIFGDILNAEDFFLPDDQLIYDEKAFEKRISKSPEAVGYLQGFREKLADAENFDAAAIDPSSGLRPPSSPRGEGTYHALWLRQSRVTNLPARVFDRCGPGIDPCPGPPGCRTAPVPGLFPW
jgi:glutamyl-tRNA synthetase